MIRYINNCILPLFSIIKLRCSNVLKMQEIDNYVVSDKYMQLICQSQSELGVELDKILSVINITKTVYKTLVAEIIDMSCMMFEIIELIDEINSLEYLVLGRTGWSEIADFSSCKNKIYNTALLQSQQLLLMIAKLDNNMLLS